MIDELEESTEKSLGDNEIASLMKTLSTKQYRENPSFPKRVLDAFKPISLLEVATKNIDNNQTEILLKEDKTTTQEENLVHEDISVEDEISPKNKNQDDKDISQLQDGINEIPNEENKIELNNQSNNTTENLENENNEIEPNLNSETEKTEKTNIGIPIKEKLFTKEELEREYKNGFIEGTEKLKKEYLEEQESSQKILNNIIKKIADKISIDTNVLEKHIKEEIIKITSERVGLAIDTMPEEFIKKIKTLAKMISKKSQSGIFKVNPEDFESINTLLKKSDNLEELSFSTDQSLERGDVIFEIGGLSLEDKIGDRYGTKEEGTRHFELSNNEGLNYENLSNSNLEDLESGENKQMDSFVVDDNKELEIPLEKEPLDSGNLSNQDQKKQLIENSNETITSPNDDEDEPKITQKKDIYDDDG